MSEETDSPTDHALAAALDHEDSGVDIDAAASQLTDQIPDETLQRLVVSCGYRSYVVETAARYLFQQTSSQKAAWGFASQLEKEWQERLASLEQAPAQIQQQESFLENMRIRRRLIKRLDARLNTQPFLLPLASKGLVGLGDALETLVIYRLLMKISGKIGEEVVSQQDSGWHTTYGWSEIDTSSATDNESEDASEPLFSSAEEGTSSAQDQKSYNERTANKFPVSKKQSPFEKNIAAGFSRLGLSSADPVSRSTIPQDEEQQPDLAKIGENQESAVAPPDIHVTDADEAELEEDLVHVKDALRHNPAFRSKLVTELHGFLNDEQDPERKERKGLIEEFIGQWVDADLSQIHEAKAETLRMVMAAAGRRAELFSNIKAWFAATSDAIARAASNQVGLEEAVELAEIHAERAAVDRDIHGGITLFMKVAKASEETVDVGDQGGEAQPQAGVKKDAE